jgi:hypothetical protein
MKVLDSELFAIEISFFNQIFVGLPNLAHG